MGFGDIDPLPFPPRPTMPWFRKSKKSKSHRPSQQGVSLGVPTHIATGPTGFGATLDLGTDSDGKIRLIEVQRSMELIRLWLQAKTTEGVPRSHFWVGEAGISRLKRRVSQPRLPGARTAPRVSVSRHSH